MTRVHVTKSDPPESKEILAEAIIRISEALSDLNKSGINRHAVEVLIHDATKVKRSDIRTILDALPRLRGWYCR